jgi:peptidoglycan/LPS O-acetylase OafA/YrhL
VRGLVVARQESRPNTRERNGYFDLLRAAALLRVITYHTLGWPWLHVAIPAIGVMFALAGSLMAASLSRRSALPVLASRARRLLPPVWAFGIVGLAVGWLTLGSGGHEWYRLLFWLLPLRDPESNSTGFGFVDILWYVRTYLWFVILSPVFLVAFRKAPAVTLIAPLALLPAVALGHYQWAGRGALIDLLGFGACWMLGFADHDGFLQKAPLLLCGAVFAALGCAGLIVMLAFAAGPSGSNGPNFIGYALWSTAFVFALMRWRPDTARLKTIGWLHCCVRTINARAVTIYIWHDAAVVVTAKLVHATRLPFAHAAQLPTVLILTAVATLAFGWVEDLAARRRPAFLPVRLRRRRPIRHRPSTLPRHMQRG